MSRFRTGFVERALGFFAAHGITAKRLMTDNGFSYVKNRSFRELLVREGIRRDDVLDLPT